MFRQPPDLGFAGYSPGAGACEPDELVIRLFPATGIEFTIEAHPVNKPGAGPVALDTLFG